MYRCAAIRAVLHLPFRFVLTLVKFCSHAGQVDKLVQLLESPIFLRLRLQLLDVDSPSYPALLKSLYGILMLLPQVRYSSECTIKLHRLRSGGGLRLTCTMVADSMSLGIGR